MLITLVRMSKGVIKKQSPCGNQKWDKELGQRQDTDLESVGVTRLVPQPRMHPKSSEQQRDLM